MKCTVCVGINAIRDAEFAIFDVITLPSANFFGRKLSGLKLPNKTRLTVDFTSFIAMKSQGFFIRVGYDALYPTKLQLYSLVGELPDNTAI